MSTFGDRLYELGGIPVGASGAQAVSNGSVYFVDLNYGSDSNQDGASLKKPFKSLTKALAISHADIARGSDRWARRNTIYACGDAFTEDLTASAQKTDIIGIGSYDAFKGAGLIGNHVPVNTALGTRWYNFQFRGDSSGGDMFTLSTANQGIEFHNCRFHADGGTAATGAILPTAVRFMKIDNCIFEGAFSDAVIQFGAGNASGTIISNNLIQGANNGIECSSSMTMTPEIGYIINNIFHVTALGVKDEADKFMVVGNRVYSAVATATTGTLIEVMDCNVKLAFDNYISAGNVTNCRFPVVAEAGA